MFHDKRYSTAEIRLHPMPSSLRRLVLRLSKRMAWMAAKPAAINRERTAALSDCVAAGYALSSGLARMGGINSRHLHRLSVPCRRSRLASMHAGYQGLRRRAGKALRSW